MNNISECNNKSLEEVTDLARKLNINISSSSSKSDICNNILRQSNHLKVKVRSPFKRLLNNKSTSLKIRSRPIKHIQDLISNQINDNKINIISYFESLRHLIQKCDSKNNILNDEEIINLLHDTKNNPGNLNKMKNIQCIVQSIYELTSKYISNNHENDKEGIYFMLPNIQKIFTPLKRISSNSYGDIYSSGYKDKIENCFLIKCPIGYNRYIQPTFHEAVIGFQLNECRKYTSGFLYSYGGFFSICPSKFCKEKSDQNFISVFEYPKGNTLYESISLLSIKDFKEIILMILNILSIGYKELQFRHNNCIASSIILRKGNNINHTIDNKTFSSTWHPTFINYESSVLYVKNEWVIPLLLKEDKSGIISFCHLKENLPLWDIFCLIQSISICVYNSKLNEHWKCLSPILDWFSSESKKFNCNDTLMHDLDLLKEDNSINYDKLPSCTNDPIIIPFLKSGNINDLISVMSFSI